MKYQPLIKLGQAITEFAKDLTEDIKSIYEERPSTVITYPNGIPSITNLHVQLQYTLLDDGWKPTIYVDGDELGDTSIERTLAKQIRDYVQKNVTL
jgi:hypothetical protein